MHHVTNQAISSHCYWNHRSALAAVKNSAAARVEQLVTVSRMIVALLEPGICMPWRSFGYCAQLYNTDR